MSTSRPARPSRLCRPLALAVTMAVVGLWASPAFASTVGPWTPEVGVSKKAAAAVVVVVVVVAAVVAFFVVRRNR